MKWEAIASIESCGEAEVACIKVSADDELYITADGIVTHNTSSDPNKLQKAYIDRDGEVQVLDFVKPEDRDQAITEAAIPAGQIQNKPDLEKIYAKPTTEVQKEAARLAGDVLYSQSDKEYLELAKNPEANKTLCKRW